MKAIPMIIGVWIRSAAFGLRPIDSMAAATARPWPKPAPTAAMPMARPAAMAIQPFELSAYPSAANAGVASSIVAADMRAAFHCLRIVLVLLSSEFKNPSATPLCPPRHSSAAGFLELVGRSVLRRYSFIFSMMFGGVRLLVVIVVGQCQRQIDDAQNCKDERLDQRHEGTERVEDHRHTDLGQPGEDLEDQMVAGHVAEETQTQ